MRKYISDYLLELIVENNFKKFVEIGLWQCVNARKILKKSSGILDEYWGVDNFNHEESGYHRALDWETWNNAYNKACKFMYYFSSFRVVRMKSKDASELFPDNYFDIVYIDASHDYDSVIEDIKCWESKIREGGVISGHDYISNKYQDVKKAVNDIYKEEKIKELPGGSWYVKL